MIASKDDELARCYELESSTRQDIDMAHRKNVQLKYVYPIFNYMRQQLSAKELELRRTLIAIDVLNKDGAEYVEERKHLLLKCRETEAQATKKIQVLESEVKASRALIVKLKARDEVPAQDEKINGCFGCLMINLRNAYHSQ
jgi:hypothetical protein